MRSEVTVRTNNDDTKCIVRKAIFGEDGRLEKRYYLNIIGEWEEYTDGMYLPRECEFVFVKSISTDDEPKVENEIKADTPLFRLTLASGKSIAIYGVSPCLP